MTINIEREAVITNDLPMSLALDTSDGTTQILQALARAPFAHGAQPYARGKTIKRLKPDAPLTASTGRLLRQVSGDGATARLYAGDGWTMRTMRWASGGAYISVVAVTDELAEAVVEEAAHDAEDVVVDGRVSIGFWHHNGHHTVRVERRMEPRTWAESRDNYPADLARLHPATIRPGRCLAQIEVGPMSRDEASCWLGTSAGIGPHGATLAELYALRDGDPMAAPAAATPTGMYL